MIGDPHERRARTEDYVAHLIAVIIVTGFFALAFAALLGYVDLKEPTVATAFGTVMGYAVGKIDPILTRYFISRSLQPPRHPGDKPPDATQPPTQEPKP